MIFLSIVLSIKLFETLSIFAVSKEVFGDLFFTEWTDPLFNVMDLIRQFRHKLNASLQKMQPSCLIIFSFDLEI